MGVPQMAQPPKTLASRIASVPHPIITVTQHTPSPTPTPSVSEEGGGSGGGAARPFLRDLSRRPAPLNRSYSDSDVSYSAEELTEAAGSTYYINKHGGIDLVMLLKVEVLTSGPPGWIAGFKPYYAVIFACLLYNLFYKVSTIA